MIIKHRVIKYNWSYIRVVLAEHCIKCCFSYGSGVCTLSIDERHKLKFCLRNVLENEREIADSGVSKNYVYQLTKL